METEEKEMGLEEAVAVWREILERNSRNVILTEDRVEALRRLLEAGEEWRRLVAKGL